ncbi:hypothetical protein C8N37_10460 [Sphingobacterium faecium]|nr:hypothetical protein C8N37_10460 [Sphingobacterium faecium]
MDEVAIVIHISPFLRNKRGAQIHELLFCFLRYHQGKYLDGIFIFDLF